MLASTRYAVSRRVTRGSKSSRLTAIHLVLLMRLADAPCPPLVVVDTKRTASDGPVSITNTMAIYPMVPGIQKHNATAQCH